MACQLEFFSDPLSSNVDMLRDEMQHVKASSDKVRKSMFARHNELARKYTELHDRMQIIERNLCRGDVTMSLQS